MAIVEPLRRLRNWPSDWGADPTGGDGVATFEAACAAALNHCGRVHIPSGHTYKATTGEIEVAAGQEFTGDGENVSKIIVGAAFNTVLLKLSYWANVGGFSIINEDLGDWEANNGDPADVTAGSRGIEIIGGGDAGFPSNMEVKRIKIWGLEEGIRMDVAGVTALRRIYAQSCKYGLRFTGTQTNVVLVDMCELWNCTKGCLDDSNGSQIKFLLGAIENCHGYGYHKTTQSRIGVSFDGTYFEKNNIGGTGYDIRTESAASIAGVSIHNCWFNDTDYGIYLAGCYRATIDNNTFKDCHQKSIYLAGTNARFAVIRQQHYLGTSPVFSLATDDLGRGTIYEANTPYQFGALGKGGQDDRAALQAWIDSNKNRADLIWPADDFRIDAPLWASYGSGDYTTFRWIGKGGYTKETGPGLTRITCNFADASAVVVQGCREGYIEGFEIIGQNTGVLDLTASHTNPSSAMTDNADDYISSGVSKGRYNPHAGIAVDPYSGSQPGSEYYPGGYYTGSRFNTTLLTIVRCTLRNFVVGVMVKPSDNDSNGDHVRVIRTHFRDCTYSYAAGNSQARGCVLEKCLFFAGYKAIECCKFGRQIGAPPQVARGSLTGFYWFIGCDSAFGHVDVSGLYAESLKGIGHVGRGNSSSQLTACFSRCHFKLRNTPNVSGIDSTDPAVHLYAFMPTQFVGCVFSTQQGVLNIVRGLNEIKLDTYEVNVFSTWSDIFYLGLVDSAGSTGIIAQNGQFATTKYLLASTSRWNAPDTEVQLSSIPARLDFSLHTRRVQGPRFTYSIENTTAATNRTRISASASSYSVVGSTLTFTAADGTDFAVGDVLYWQTAQQAYASNRQDLVPAWKITGIVSNAITATAVVGVGSLNSAYAPATVGIAYRPYAFTSAVLGTTTSGSPSITGVTSATTLFQVGDFIQGAGIPSLARVTGVSGTTVTISKNATASASNVALYLDHAWRDDVPKDSPEAWGAAANGVTDDFKAIMAPLNYFNRCGLLAKSYAFGSKITVPQGALLYGSGMQSSQLLPGSLSGVAIEVGLRSTVRDLWLDGVDTASTIGFQFASTNGLIDRCQIFDMAKGVVFPDGFAGNRLRNGRIASCATSGVEVNSANASTIDEMSIESCGIGIDVVGQPAALKITGGLIALSESIGIYFRTGASARSAQVAGVHFTSNGSASAGIDILVQANVRALAILSCVFDTSNTCIAISNGNDGSICRCTFNPAGDDPTSIAIGNSAATNWLVGPNTYLVAAFDPSIGADNQGTGTRFDPPLKAAQTINVDSISGTSAWSTNIVLAGARPGDAVAVSESPALPDGIAMKARVSANDTVTVALYNPTGAPIDPPSTTFNVAIVK